MASSYGPIQQSEDRRPFRGRARQQSHRRGLRQFTELTFHGSEKTTNLETWYENFTVCHTCQFVVGEVWPIFIFYSAWSGFIIFWESRHPGYFIMFRAGALLKVLTFLTGLLISFVLKESLDRYRKCLSALVDFQSEFCGMWYMAQQNLIRKTQPARVIMDVHMVLFTISLTRYLLKKAKIARTPEQLADMVPHEFAHLEIFRDEGAYGAVNCNPTYAEVLMVSWMRACGIYNGEMRKHVEWMRAKLRTLLNEQRSKSPATSTNLLAVVTHLFLIMVPLCVKGMTSRCFVPIISSVLFALLRYSSELEDPFGVDRHDLPWPVMLGNVSSCTLCEESMRCKDKALEIFEYACEHDEWPEEQTRELFGETASFEPYTSNKFDTGVMHFDLYLTLPKLKYLEVVASQYEKEPDSLFDPLISVDDEDLHVFGPGPGFGTAKRGEELAGGGMA